MRAFKGQKKKKKKLIFFIKVSFFNNVKTSYDGSREPIASHYLYILKNIMIFGLVIGFATMFVFIILLNKK